ncbi:hypothetical protein BGZ60DRAFT_390804 [Tricladium varicosporioides]|nr:hypothetical protein BGZ60DRAFT_390804 [Hymenoscyphus varicosporioides]
MVLKVDQPTGREVQGIVAQILTKGDHPRGIKVRLQDGRVGRVQRMVSEETAKAASEGLSDLGRNGEMGDRTASSQVMTSPAAFSPRYSDFRVDSLDAPPSSCLSLEDYVVVKGPQKARKKKGSAPDQEEENAEQSSIDVSENPITSVTSTCPVCGEFEGDEAAVAHHVSEHFD